MNLRGIWLRLFMMQDDSSYLGWRNIPIRNLAKFGMILMDAAVFAGAMWLALSTRYGTFFPPSNIAWAIAVAPVTGVISLILFGYYRELLRYVGPTLAYRAGMAVSLATLILLSVSFLSSAEESISRIVFVPFWMGSVLGVIGFRLGMRIALALDSWRQRRYPEPSTHLWCWRGRRRPSF